MLSPARAGSAGSIGFVVAVGVATLLGFAFAVLLRNAQHFYFAVGTLGLAEVLLIVFQRWILLTGRSSAEILSATRLSVFGWVAQAQPRQFLVMLVFLAVVLFLGALMARSPMVRSAIAARDNPRVLDTLGVDARWPGVVMFTLGCGISAAAGSLFVHTRGIGTPETFGIELGIGVFVALILGGLHSLWGGLIGAWFYVYVPLYLERWESWTLVIWGAVLVFVMIVFPDGLVGLVSRVRASITGRGGRKRPKPGEPLRPLLDVADPGGPAPRRSGERHRHCGTAAMTDVLEAREIGVSFGLLRACDGVDLSVPEGAVLGLTGPNGSGKSTFMNAVTGLVPATDRSDPGSPRPAGRPRAVRELGVARAFQSPQNWAELSCLENVLLGSDDRQLLGLIGAVFRRPSMRAREQARWADAERALERVGLADLVLVPAAQLTYGQQRMLELARAIVGRPSLLLLDEPSAGLNAVETEELGTLLSALRQQGMAILVIDHKIDFLDRICDRITVLQLGKVIAEGRPDEIWTHRDVIEAYLGADDA